MILSFGPPQSVVVRSAAMPTVIIMSRILLDNASVLIIWHLCYNL